MLRKATALMCAIVCGCALLGLSQVSYADDTGCGTRANAGGVWNTEVEAKIGCPTSSGGSSGSGGSGGSQDSRFKSDEDHAWDFDYGDSAAADSCYALDGGKVDCWFGDYWWSPAYGMWCKVADEEYREKYIIQRADGTRDDSLILYRCTTPDRAPGAIDELFWGQSSQPTIDPETVIREQVVTLELHPPSVGVGAFVYPDARDWGLSWWVGAPMWLFVDADDPLQWGTHQLSVSLEGVTMNATVQANRVTYDPGDGSAPVVCTNQGVERPFNDRELMRNHSPYGCEHIYMKTNTLGDKSSRYVVSAVVTWRVTWSATNGQSGAFSFDVASVESPAVHIGVIRVVDKIW